MPLCKAQEPAQSSVHGAHAGRIDPAHHFGFVAVRIVGLRDNQQRLPASLGFEHPPTLPLGTLAGEFAPQFAERLVILLGKTGQLRLQPRISGAKAEPG